MVFAAPLALVVALAQFGMGAPGWAAAGSGEEYLLSPPAQAPGDRPPGGIVTDLLELEDAAGLAFLLGDDAAAARLVVVRDARRQALQPTLEADRELAELDRALQEVFVEGLADRARPASEVRQLVMALERRRLRSVVRSWLQSLFHSRKVFFVEDLDALSRDGLLDLCRQARSFDDWQALSPARYRTLLSAWRDREVRRLFEERDRRMRLVSAVRFAPADLPEADARLLRRYQAMLRNLRLQVLDNRSLPFHIYRSLDGLRRGLRYMETIRQACAATGLDHRLMTRLFIQESEFIHQRISWAGAFSLAQFMDVALKDVWQFRAQIAGSAELLRGVESFEDLRRAVIADPRQAIRTACLYFRRVRDGVVRYLESDGAAADPSLATLLALELFRWQEGVAEGAALDVDREIERLALGERLLEAPPVAVPGALPDPAGWLSRWMVRAAEDLTRLRLTEEVFRGRLEMLHSALGLAAYNCGLGRLARSDKQQKAFCGLAFPMQIAETRDYVSNILAGLDVLKRAEALASDTARMTFHELMDLAEQACRKAGEKASVLPKEAAVTLDQK
ncbi:MAG: hypothetical protein GYA21_06320 [Myxococcales bacterium]|nr:hypothetical protein [Myxococcales bacterium]